MQLTAKLFLSMALIVGSARAGVTYDASAKVTTAASSGSFAYDAAGTSMTAVFFAVGQAVSNVAMSGVSYAGQTLTKLSAADPGGVAAYSEIWGLRFPATGSNSFTWTSAVSVTRAIAVLSYDNVIGFGESLTNTISSGTNMRLTANASTLNSTYIFSLASSNSAGGWSTFPTSANSRSNTAGIAPNGNWGDCPASSGTTVFTFVKAVGSGTNAGAALEMQPLNSPTPTVSPTGTYTKTPTNTSTWSPTRSPTSTFTSTRSPTPTFTWTPTATPTWSPTSTFTPTITRTPTPTITLTPTPTVTLTATPTITLTETPTITLTETPTITLTPTPTITDTASPTSTSTPDLGGVAPYDNGPEVAPYFSECQTFQEDPCLMIKPRS